jgi:uncharacterized tellurite resistance protein B-like protein
MTAILANSSTMIIALLIFLAAATLAFSVMAEIRVRGAVKRGQDGVLDMTTRTCDPISKRGHDRTKIMLNSLKSFFTDLTTGEKPQGRFDESDYRLAAAALLVHAAAIDGNVSAAERDRLHAIISRRFALDADAAKELIDKATAAEHEAIDLYQFTSLINRALDEEGRCRIVEMLWQIVYADGQVGEFEDNLIWRTADLLHVSRHERIALRRSVAREFAKSDRDG